MMLKTQTALVAVGLMVCVQAIAPSVYAGPSNRRAKTQSNYPINLDGFGAPLPAVANSTPDLAIFATGQLNFKEIDSIPSLGPLFNGTTCAGCHSQPSMGGGGLFINEIRVRHNTDPGPVHIFAVDNMLRNGPQTRGTRTIFPGGISTEPLGCQITSPRCQLSACQQEEVSKTSFSTSLPTCDPTSADYIGGGESVGSRRHGRRLLGERLLHGGAFDFSPIAARAAHESAARAYNRE